ncbi:MAG: glycosyltransferase family 2 protein [Burkholderiales bacterium]|nr:glycosyltransferase family 2 protein [Burkholderiales bacterium]
MKTGYEMGGALSTVMLSIVVPTYNRAQLLNGLLESVVQDFDQWPEDLELIVSDNASPDETGAVIRGFLQRGYPISYIVNETNIGADGNIAASFDLARGKYLWVIGDDEVMYRGTVEYVLALCRTENFGLLHLSSSGFVQGQQNSVCTREKPDMVKIESVSSRKLFRLTNIFLTFISANVVNRALIKDRFRNFDAYAELNSSLSQLSWTFKALEACEIHYYVSTPLFGALANNSGGYKLIEVFGINLIAITKKYLQGVIPNAERIMTNAIVTRFLPREILSQMISEHKNEFENENIAEITTSCFKENLYFQLFLKPMLSGSETKTKKAFHRIRVLDKMNRRLGYALL